jgi:hypothetical protein
MNRSADEIIHHSTEERSDREETRLGLYTANIRIFFFTAPLGLSAVYMY